MICTDSNCDYAHIKEHQHVEHWENRVNEHGELVSMVSFQIKANRKGKVNE